jgi:hypothetical protein
MRRYGPGLAIVALAALIILYLVLTGQGGRDGQSPSPTSSETATSTASASPAETTPGTTPTVTPTESTAEPTSALGPFECELPASLPATIDRAQVVDVRVGTHPEGAPGYDRIVFEFQEGIPEVELREGEPPFTQDPSGLPMEVDGESFLVLVMHGATGVTPDGEMTYEGETEFSPGFPTLTELEQAGDFEAVSEWVIGMTTPACHRLFTLDSPSRLVIDLEHP